MECFKKFHIGLLLILLSFNAEATPFNSCPSKAFLIQDSVAQMYRVNLVTGNYNLLSSDLRTNNKVNAVGFNFHENYIYGWGYEWGTVVRIGSDFQAEPLMVSNKPDTNFYVGDVGLSENTHYVYRKGSSFGLYKISLDESDIDFLDAKRIIDGASLSLSIFDFAFHPTNGFAYSVDKNGILFRINVNNGSSTSLGNVGITGTFGAVYFDVNGNFYISRNQDGQIFRIDIAAVTPSAEVFAYGPSSGNNDGARCAIAPIVDDSEPPITDFGDAPDSYRTSLSNNGARHGVSDDIYLGNTVDAEYDAYVYPLTEESTSNDEDGINFISGFEAGLDSLLQVTVKGAGYLNIWVDWDQNGQFDFDEQLVYDRTMDTGTETFLAETPFDVEPGTTWARVRYSSTLGVSAKGGVAYGEVEDYQILVLNPGFSLVSNNPYFLAFEDKWPGKGDYDFNDVVIQLDSSLIVNVDNQVKQLKLEGELKAMGASYRNGFAIQLDGITNSDIDQAMIRFEINGEASNVALLEQGTAYAVLKISDDLRAQVKPDNACWYYKTEPECSSSPTFNPFIFATPDTEHGSIFYENQGRGLEIHLKKKPPTSLVNEVYFGLSDDASDPDASLYYQTNNGVPWGIAINIGESENWFHPYKWVSILKAYPKFEDYATSNGVVNPAWFQNNNAALAKTYHY